MFTIFRKRARKFSSELDELKAEAAALVMRAGDHIGECHRVIETLHDEIHEAQYVIETVQLRVAIRLTEHGPLSNRQRSVLQARGRVSHQEPTRLRSACHGPASDELFGSSRIWRLDVSKAHRA